MHIISPRTNRGVCGASIDLEKAVFEAAGCVVCHALWREFARNAKGGRCV